jgi:nitrogenase molybdenum-cofactor synthesis protein NifE
MLNAKLQDLFNEPGCAVNRAKAAADRKAGCAKSLTPGAAAGGCCFDGAKIALQPITDVVHLVHGPLACEGNSWDSRNASSSGSDLYRRGFTTDLDNLDIIHGGERKLYKAIRRAVERYRPAAVFVYQTCVGALIGDDIGAVCKAARDRLGLPVVPIDAPGFVGSKNLGNRLGGDALSNHVIGTIEPDDVSPTDVNLLGEYNVAGELDQIRPLLARLGVRLRVCISGDARYAQVAAAHTARANMVVCSQAMVTLARTMRDRWGIPYFEGSFYGISETSQALTRLARLLVERGAERQLVDRAKALTDAEEAAAWAQLAPFRARLAGKRALLYTGGVKSWSVISALQDVGIEVIGTSVRKSTAEDKERIRGLMGEDAPMHAQIPGGEMYRMLRAGQADILLSGGRTQFIALKSRTPWLDINQERHSGYAGYAGTIELVRQIDRALANPVWQQVRRPAPWECPDEDDQAWRTS